MPEEGKHYRFQKYEFWASNGMISLVDTEMAADSNNDEQFHWRIPPGEFIKRALACVMADPETYASESRQFRRLLEEAKDACKLAKAQGDPTDDSVLDHVIKHRRKKGVLVMPHELPPMPGQAPLVVKPKGKPENILAEGVNVVPDLTIG